MAEITAQRLEKTNSKQEIAAQIYGDAIKMMEIAISKAEIAAQRPPKTI